ncbi:hypothetical protein E3N88_25751 [Mikania micrantha]|uniref:Reverse transcriptase/retrotransposon-derived protein RNase H-like domain-containing protein n=1 Tax=Mikania micrantha TaxID=192012 RepID=A0A5N6N6K0_9ASTR|nr:hypothetical protein E3N88_25751 [Mikania micrantha]
MLQLQSFFVKLSKYYFGKSQLPFLGHILTTAGVQVDKDKISAIVSLPVPTNVIADEAAAAFDKLKQALITTHVLCLPNFNVPFIVECDASSEGVDHFTLKFLLEQRVTTSELQRLLMNLIPYDFSIIYCSGKENQGADALSRRPQDAALLTLVVSYCIDVSDIYVGFSMDPYTANIISSLKSDPTLAPNYKLVDQALLYKGTLVVPDYLDLRGCILNEARATPMAKHGGFLKTVKRISSHFYWPKLS